MMKLKAAKEEYQKLMRGKSDPFNTDHLAEILKEHQGMDPGDRLFYSVNDALMMGYVAGFRAANGKKKGSEKIGSSD